MFSYPYITVSKRSVEMQEMNGKKKTRKRCTMYVLEQDYAREMAEFKTVLLHPSDAK